MGNIPVVQLEIFGERAYGMDYNGNKKFETKRILLGVAYSQGGREHMQDVFSINLHAGGKVFSEHIDFMGVMDGHGPNGEAIAMFLATNLCDTVLNFYEKGQHFLESIKTACLLIDTRMRSAPNLKDETGQIQGGSTCTAIWIKEKRIYSCNVGDSRFILSYKGKAFPVTEDHKPMCEKERQRIYNAGGSVSDNRLNGILSVSRAFGDFQFKADESRSKNDQLVTALPDVFTVDIDPNIDFMVLASDGVWDVMSNQQVVDFVKDRLHTVRPINKIATLLIDTCDSLGPTICGAESDNLTCIIAMFKDHA